MPSLLGIDIGTSATKLVLLDADVGVLAQVLKDRRFVSVPYSDHPGVIFCNAEHRFARRRSIRTAELSEIALSNRPALAGLVIR